MMDDQAGGRGRLALPDVPPGEHREKPHPPFSATSGPPNGGRRLNDRRPRTTPGPPPVVSDRRLTQPPPGRDSSTAEPEPLRLGVTASHESCVFLHGLFADQASTRPPSGDGSAYGRSVVFLDEVDAGAD